MTDFVERVARAIAAADQEDYMEDCQRYDVRARAAIEAMREPTEAMTNHPTYINGEWSRRTWEASMRAALGED